MLPEIARPARQSRGWRIWRGFSGAADLGGLLRAVSGPPRCGKGRGIAPVAARRRPACGAVEHYTLKSHHNEAIRRRGIVYFPSNALKVIPSAPVIAPVAWSRTTAWRRVQQVVRLAENPQYLFESKITPTCFWSRRGLSASSATAHKEMPRSRADRDNYASAVGDEERNLARRVCSSLELAIPDRTNPLA